MKTKRIHSTRLLRHPQALAAVDQLEAGLHTQDEASWYAERLERLGRILFGDLWDTEARKDSQERADAQ
jgi:hypothetical protein